jgi:cytochrome P450
VEQRLHAELDEVLEGRPATYSDVATLDYTRRLITETLRKRTQGLFLAKVTTRQAELGDYVLPAGATVIYSFHALNHNPAIHTDPQRFDPDRWLAHRGTHVAKQSFMPFGLGAYGCIGERFAWTEMVIALATIAASWRLVPASTREPQPKIAITMPVDALPMTTRLRVAAAPRDRSNRYSAKGVKGGH